MSIDGESLICPITQEVFHDPVIAEDGRLYERAAITRWINEHGTSPFTRQILDVNLLQSDEEVRKKAEQRRRLSVSYNRETDQVQLPSIRSSSNIADDSNNTDVDARYLHQSTFSQNRFCLFWKKWQMIWLVGLLIIATIVATVTASALALRNNGSTSTPMSKYNVTIPLQSCRRYSVLSVDSCLASFSSIGFLSSVLCDNFTYQFFDYSFRASSSSMTIIFAFQQISGFWNIDNITLFDKETKENIFHDGDFESGFLSPNYRQCRSKGNISKTNPFNGRYSYFDGTREKFGYLMQKVTTTVGTLYDLSFYLGNRYASNSRFMVLLATGG